MENVLNMKVDHDQEDIYIIENLEADEVANAFLHCIDNDPDHV